MVARNSIFDCEASFNPDADFEAFLRLTPAKWVVCLMSDAGNTPVQLMCVRNLRQSLRRRLGDADDPLARSKRINYRTVVRHIHWKRVDSEFEADARYLEAARHYFPRSYKGILGFEPAWFVHVDPDADFPRYSRTTDLSRRAGMLIGPIDGKHAAARLIEQTVDWFDLCRYHNILLQSPHAKPCAYKEMGKCPGPCDGSISMNQYRRLVEWSAHTIVDPQALLREHTARMRAAATELRFEVAGKIKLLIESMSQLGHGALRHAGFLRDFKFLSLQRGPRRELVKVFLITPGQIEEIGGLINAAAESGEILQYARELSEARAVDGVDAVGAERMALVTDHLFNRRTRQGVFLRLDAVDEKSIRRACRDLLREPAQTHNDEEGIVKHLTAP